MKSLSGVGALPRGVARALTVGLLLGSAGLGMTVAAGPAAAEDSPNNYALMAQGDGMYILITNARLPAGLPGPISPYAAHAETNSVGVNEGFAGAPYLGPLLQTLPGLVGGLSVSTLPPLPPLPGFVTSEEARPIGRQATGAYLVESITDENGTDARASVGVAASTEDNTQAFARATARANEDGSTITQASSGVTGAAIGPISLLDVSTNVSVSSDPDGKTTVANTTNFGTISIAGITIGLTEDGFTVLGAPIPAPTDAIFDTLNTLLAAGQTKISIVESVKEVDEDTGETFVQSAALRVESVQDIPGLGPVNVEYVLGRSTVRSRNAPLEPFGGGGEPTEMPTTTPPTEPPMTEVEIPPVDTGNELPPFTPVENPTIPTIPESPVVPPAEPPTFPTEEPITGGGVPPNNQPPVRELGALPGPELGDDTELLYLVLVLGGLGAFAGQQLFSRFGVQLMLRQP